MRLSIQELCEKAGVYQIRSAPVPRPDEMVHLAQGLIEIRKAGVLGDDSHGDTGSVYCDAGRFSIRLAGEDVRHSIGRQTVARWIDKFQELARKGATGEMRFKSAEKKSA